MSLLFCVYGIAMVIAEPALLSEGMLVTWALFAVADALWVKVLLGGK